MFQPSIRKNRVNEGNEKVTSSMKSIRKERWLSAISSTGLPNFSAKLLRDYSMLADSNPFFEMLSLYDASPASFQAGLSRWKYSIPPLNSWAKWFIYTETYLENSFMWTTKLLKKQQFQSILVSLSTFILLCHIRSIMVCRQQLRIFNHAFVSAFLWPTVSLQNSELDKYKPQKYIFLDVSTTPSGKSALHLAAWKGPLSHVIALLDRGVPIDMHSTSPGNFL